MSVATLALVLVLAALGGRFAVDMLQLARQGTHNDFAILYTAAHLYRAGRSFYDSQPGRADLGAVNESPPVLAAARRLGTLHSHGDYEHIHHFSYPPFAVLPFVPLTALSFRAAAVLWQALSLGFLVLAGLCLWRAVPLSAVTALTLAALALVFEPLENSLGLGQINLLVLALVGAFLWALTASRPVLAGAALGVAIALRLHPAIFLLYLAWRGAWRALTAAAVTAAGCTVAAIALIGWAATVEYATVMAPKYARAFVGLGNLSLSGWLGATGAALFPAASPDTWRLLGQAVSAAAVVGAFAWLRPPGPATRARVVEEVAFLVVVLLLVVPNTTINHLVFAFIPLAVLLERALAEGRVAPLAWLAAAVVLTGAIDDYYQHPRLAHGLPVVLGGIKTYGLLILAALSAAHLREPAPRLSRSVAEAV